MLPQKNLDITTLRLRLSPPEETDIQRITTILTNDIYSKNTMNIPFPYTEDNARFWLALTKNGFEKGNQFIFAIRLKENNQLIGGIDLGIDQIFNKAELGYWLDKDYWNNGYTTEAVIAMIHFGFEKLKLKRIFASHFDCNTSSGRVLEKAGMKKEGVLLCHTCKNGKYQNHHLYAIINK